MWFIGVEVEQETSAPPHKKKILDPPLLRLLRPYHFQICQFYYFFEALYPVELTDFPNWSMSKVKKSWKGLLSIDTKNRCTRCTPSSFLESWLGGRNGSSRYLAK